MASEKAVSAGPRAPLRNIVTASSLAIPAGSLLIVITYYLPRHYVSLGIDGLGVGSRTAFLAVAGAISLTRVIDVFFDPLVALAMDRTKTWFGRYRVWTVAGVPLVVFGLWKLLMPPEHVTTGYLILYLVITYAGTSMTTLGMAAWLSLLSRTYHDRSRVFAVQYIMTVIGVIAVVILPLLTQGRIAAGVKGSMPTLGLILAVAFPVAVVFTLFTPEKTGGEAARPTYRIGDYVKALGRPAMARLIFADLMMALGGGAVGPLYVYFWHDVKGFTVPDVGLLIIPGCITGLLVPVWGRVANRLGKHWTLMTACVCFAIAQTILVTLPRVHAPYTALDTVPTLAAVGAVGFCTASFQLLIRAMVADVADEVKLEVGQDFTGLLFSMVTTTTKIGQSVTVLIVFPMLAAIGYNGAEEAVNTPHAILGLQLIYVLTPITLIGLGGLAMIGYKLDARRHAEIRARLDQQEAADLPLVGAAAPVADAPVG